MNVSSAAAQPAGLPTPVGRQTDVIYLNADRDQVVLGTAGSGKTTMAVYRSVHLADATQPHGGRTLLVTYNNALRSYLQHLVGAGHHHLDVRNYHTVVRGYLNSRRMMGYNQVAQHDSRARYMAAAIAEVRAVFSPGSSFFDRPLKFFLDELDWISGHGYTTKERYLEAERRGRVTSLNRRTRAALWQIRERYLANRASGGQRYDWWDMPTAMINALASDSGERLYKHIVIDEGQDLPPEAIRSLKQLTQPDGTVTLFADYAQQLYGQRSTWEACGLDITRPELFKENYRNSAGIARLAIATAALPHFTRSADLVEPNEPAAAGVSPTLVLADNLQTELALVRRQAQTLSATGTVAVLTPTRAGFRWFLRGLPYSMLSDDSTWSSANGIYGGTYFAAKGLEFDTVILPQLDAAGLPDPSDVEALGEAEARERAARLLYVGITRARSELLGTYTTELTELLPAPHSGLWLIPVGSS